MEFVNTLGKSLDKVLENKTNTLVISLILVLYAGLAAPALPNSVIQFFDTMLGKVLFLFLIGFMASRNVQVALMIAVAYVVTLHIANKRATEDYINFLRTEQFNNYYEMFAKEGFETGDQHNRGVLIPELLKYVVTVNELLDTKILGEDNKLIKNHSDWTVKQFFEHIDSDENGKKGSKDKFYEQVKDAKLKKKKGDKFDPKTAVDATSTEDRELILKTFWEDIVDEKFKEFAEKGFAEEFENYSGENEESEGPLENNEYFMNEHFDNMEHFDNEGFDNNQLNNEQFHSGQFHNEHFVTREEIETTEKKCLKAAKDDAEKQKCINATIEATLQECLKTAGTDTTKQNACKKAKCVSEATTEDAKKKCDKSECLSNAGSDEDAKKKCNETEGFYDQMEEFSQFNVVPADNLGGQSSKMYAPVRF